MGNTRTSRIENVLRAKVRDPGSKIPLRVEDEWGGGSSEGKNVKSKSWRRERAYKISGTGWVRIKTDFVAEVRCTTSSGEEGQAIFREEGQGKGSWNCHQEAK